MLFNDGTQINCKYFVLAGGDVIVMPDFPSDVPIAAEFLATLTAMLDHALIITDRSGYIVWVNDGFVRLSGFSAAEAIGMKPGALLQGKNSDPAVIARMSGCIRDGERFSDIRIVNYNKSGAPYWVHIEVGPIRNHEGKITHFLGIQNELTKRRDESNFEELFRETFNGTSNIVLLCDTEYRLTFVNQAFLAFAGPDPDRLIGKKLLPLLYGMGVSQATLADLDSMMRAGGRSGHFEIVKFDRDGRKRTLEAEVFPRRNSMGEILGFVLFERDISRQRFLEALLSKREYQFRAMTETVPGMVYQILVKADGTHHYQWVSPRAIDMFAIDPNDLLNDSSLLAVHPDDETDWRESLARSIRDLSDWSFFGRMVSPNGKVLWVHSVARPMRHPDQAVQFNGIIVDVSAQRELEEKLAAARLAAESANKLKSEFLANMSHELRTPMNAIIGLSHLGLGMALEPRQRNYLEKILDSANSLLSILNDILDFSTIEAGEMSLERKDFSVSKLFRSLDGLLSVKAGEKGLKLTFDIDHRLPTALSGDPLRLSQVLLNLGNNAIKFTQQGEVRFHVALLGQVSDSVSLRFSVADTGIGISENRQADLFAPFVQEDGSITRRFGGVGLGLAICKRLIELMDGRFGVQSEMHKGSIFWFEITLKVGAIRAVEPSTPVSLQQVRILVIEGNDAARDRLSAELEALGCDVTSANSGQFALGNYQSAALEFDVVVIGRELPDLDGIETGQAIRALSGNDWWPVIMIVTADIAEETEIERSQGQNLKYLAQPVNASTVLNGVIAVMEEQDVVAKVGRLKPTTEGSKILQHLRILVVEDNDINQLCARELLEQAGAEVLMAENGAAAIALLAEEDVDCVLMDVQMPVLDGYSATRQLRKMPKFANLPIIAMTANTMRGDRERAFAAGMTDHIAKPIEPDEVLRVVRYWTLGDDRLVPLPAMKRKTPHHPFSSTLDMAGALLRASGNKILLTKIMRRFLDQVPVFIDEYEKARTAEDAETAIRLVHSLKGNAGTVGLPHLELVAAELEAMLRSHAGDDKILEHQTLLLRALEHARSLIIDAIKELDGAKDRRTETLN